MTIPMPTDTIEPPATIVEWELRLCTEGVKTDDCPTGHRSRVHGMYRSREVADLTLERIKTDRGKKGRYCWASISRKERPTTRKEKEQWKADFLAHQFEHMFSIERAL